MNNRKTLFSSKSLWVGERISSKFIYNLGTRPQKCSLVLFWTLSTAPTVRMTSMAHNRHRDLKAQRNMARISSSTYGVTHYEV
jgi:hypothetical protein